MAVLLCSALSFQPCHDAYSRGVHRDDLMNVVLFLHCPKQQTRSGGVQRNIFHKTGSWALAVTREASIFKDNEGHTGEAYIWGPEKPVFFCFEFGCGERGTPEPIGLWLHIMLSHH